MKKLLVLMLNFDNVSALGENQTHVVDVSGYCYDNKTEILIMDKKDERILKELMMNKLLVQKMVILQ